MKTSIATLALCLGFSFANAQHIKESEVPAAVKQAFAKKYPGTKVEKWEKEGADYEAEFDVNKTETSALFDANGNLKELEQEINPSELPKAASEYCSKNFSDHKLSEASRIKDVNGKIMYEAEMRRGKEHFDVIFDEKGNFIKKSAPEIKKEDKD